MSGKYGLDNVEYTVDGVRLYGDHELNSVLLDVITAGISIKSVNTFDGNIEDYYLSLVGGANHA